MCCSPPPTACRSPPPPSTPPRPRPAFSRPLAPTLRAAAPQVVGFSVCAPVEGVSRVVELREYRPELQAPELEGKRWCAVDELFACDVWALGVLLCCLLTGSYSAEAVAAECDEAEQSAIDAVGALDLGSGGGGGALDVGATPSTASFFGEGPASPAERAKPRDAFALVKLMLARPRRAAVGGADRRGRRGAAALQLMPDLPGSIPSHARARPPYMPRAASPRSPAPPDILCSFCRAEFCAHRHIYSYETRPHSAPFLPARLTRRPPT